MAAGLGATEWLASVLAAQTALASTSTGNQTTVGVERAEETVAVQGAAARRRGGRGGRAPRLQAPARAAPASVDVDLTNPIPPQSPIPVDGEDEPFDEENDSELEEVTPISGRGKRGRGADNTKGKKSKTSTGHWFHEQMGKIVEMNERTTASCESIARREDNSGCSIKDVMLLVKECGAVPSTNEHFIAYLVFTKRAEREMFMTFDTPEERFEWLTKKHEWMTRNDVSK
ncbi:L10-interacting MYB domain-containing protein-like [Panicum miliaceum]|uniref:L10-interacting MYB domain-containing protein-like n=1 Tax=Panicum miliaceum TaxID=4540 RepID=A0A3L6S9P2_PANMI|nr:L10-interacting MYB domain-containing protein-like [Panicum miliaceum]